MGRLRQDAAAGRGEDLVCTLQRGIVRRADPQGAQRAVGQFLDTGAIRAGIEQPPLRRRVNHAANRHAVFHQRDIHREIPPALDELLGAVQRIDEPEQRPDLGRLSCRNGLLGHDGHGGRQVLQRLDDEGLGALIGLGDRRLIILAADREVGGVHLQDDVARSTHDALHRSQPRFTVGLPIWHVRHASVLVRLPCCGAL